MTDIAADLVARMQAAIPHFERVAASYEQRDNETQRHAKFWREMAELLREASRALASVHVESIDKIPLTFDEVTRQNVERCKRWHPGGVGDWTIERWSTATAGEFGEACNVIKKLFRIDDGIANVSADPARQVATREDAFAKIGEELAGTYLYLNLLAVRCGLDLADEIVREFNKTSELYKFPERLVR